MFERLGTDDFEEVVFCQDRESGLRAIVAIHSTARGPALGGVRMWNYATEDEALEDALRLAKGMTYKNAAADLPLGGGKAVIIGNPAKKNADLLRAFGRSVQRLGGRYWTAEDVGTSVADMETIRQETRYVAGLPLESGSSGNPSPATAYGVFEGMRAAAQCAYGSSDLRGRVVAVQGAGSVASFLCARLHEAGARIIVADIREEAAAGLAKKYGAEVADPADLIAAACDIYAPCALGGVLNDETIPLIQARIVAGAANNQLLESRHGQLLHEKRILYAPDYVINAGGVINISEELNGYDGNRAYGKIGRIYDRILAILQTSVRQDIPPHSVADKLAREAVAEVNLQI